MLKSAAALLVLLASGAAAQERVVIRENAPGEAGRLLADVLSRPYELRNEPWNTRLFRDSVFARSVVIIGTDATVAAAVHGDVLVVGGNLFLRGGAHVDGRAIALGGRVIGAATVGGGTLSYPDVRFDVSGTADTVTLTWHPTRSEAPPLLTLPAPYGFRAPAYDRVDGVSLPWGPRFAIRDSVVVLAPTVTYRSNLGALDAGVAASARLAPEWQAALTAERVTATNDAWIVAGVPNSVTALLIGRDYRNYWRADRGAVRIDFIRSRGAAAIAAGGGIATERDWSVHAGGPWSVAGQDSVNGMRRPNPGVAGGRVTSLLAHLSVATPAGDVALRGEVLLERSLSTPGQGEFTQATFDGGVAFPTFGAQRFALHLHAVASDGTVPAQRYAYLGGFGSLPTFHILALGGDRLVFIESAYTVPIPALRVPLLGAPELALVHALGSAGTGGLPRFEQNIGLRLALAALQVDLALDPRTRHTVVAAGFRLWNPSDTR